MSKNNNIKAAPIVASTPIVTAEQAAARAAELKAAQDAQAAAAAQAEQLKEQSEIDRIAATVPLVSAVTAVTVNDYLDMDVLTPEFQRGYVWRPAQAAAFVENMIAGLPVPALILADIPDAPPLLIDGVQRTTTIRNWIEGIDAVSQLDSARLDALLSRQLYLMRVQCPNLETAAILFTAYNSGSTLSGIQRSKASLPPAILAQVKPYIEFAAALAGGTNNKLGKVTAEAAGLMLAAAMADTSKQSSSGTNASKVLLSAQVVPQQTDALNTISAAIALIEDSPRAYFSSPARLVPLLVMVRDTHPDADSLAAFMAGFNPLDTVRIKHKQVTGKKTKDAVASVGAIFSDTSNSHNACWARQQAFTKLYTAFVAAPADGAGDTADGDTAAAMATTVELLRAAVQGNNA